MKSELIVPISADPVTGLPRQARLEAFIIQSNLNMVNQVRVSYLTPQGGSKLEAIDADTSLSPYQQRVAREQFADRVVTRQTQGTFVDPASGRLTEEAAGAIAQRDYFQAISLGDLKAQGLPVDDTTTLADLIYAMLAGEIKKSDARKEI